MLWRNQPSKQQHHRVRKLRLLVSRCMRPPYIFKVLREILLNFVLFWFLVYSLGGSILEAVVYWNFLFCYLGTYEDGKGRKNQTEREEVCIYWEILLTIMKNCKESIINFLIQVPARTNFCERESVVFEENIP